jgi:hypothetical protein
MDVKQARKAHSIIIKVYTPFPVGLDKAMGFSNQQD